MLVGGAAAALLLVVTGAALALRDAGAGQPIETGVGAAAEGAEDDQEIPIPDRFRPAESGAEPESERPSDDEQEVVIDTGPDESTLEPGDNGSTGDRPAQSEAAGPEQTGPADTNVDGSPRAPTPGTVAPPAAAEQAAAYGIWQPTRHDSCSKEVHDRYWVYGPDGKVYPTYHPPVDPVTGCSFGHEHGRDPAGSNLADIPFPFGYVNQQATTAGLAPRHEDHVGHKIEWYNDGGYYGPGRPDTAHDQVCDVAYKLHMGSHSDDAFRPEHPRAVPLRTV